MTLTNCFTSRFPEFLLARRLTLAASFSVLLSTPLYAEEATVLIQLNDYTGKSAYFSLYLVDAEGRYQRTLWVSGTDVRYHPDMPRWWRYISRAPQDIHALTGASTAAGDRAVIKIDLEPGLIDSGYRLRVETAVEDQATYPDDAEVDLTQAAQGEKIAGTGYVRYIRFQW